MRSAAIAFLPLLLGLVGPAADAQSKVFPFEHAVHDLDNGLRLITVPTPHPGIVSVHCIVQVGSRNEVEDGRSGFAHFFEHMMFRGTRNMTAAERAAAFKAAGADRNAYTTDDYTNYHTTVPAEELGTVLRLEADRFKNLAYPEDAFRTEAMAVFGEYNKNSSNPFNMLLERIRATAFDVHTYRHTTMGFLKDIRAMPRMFDYSRQFFDRYYRPEYVTILVVGDTTPAETRALVEEHWGDWQRGGYVADIPTEPEQTAPREVRVSWPQPTNPWIVVAFKGPAWPAQEADMSALDLIGQIAFSSSSPLYQRLFVEERKVDVLTSYFPDSRDPGLLYLLARVRDPNHWAYVRDALLAECERLKTEPVDAERLAAVKSNQRYGFVAALDSAANIAEALAGYVARTRDPESVNARYESYEAVTPAAIRLVAQRYFTPAGRTIATLSHEPLPEAEPPLADLQFPGILLPSDSPLVAVKLCFEVGAADDPEGKEGLAAISAALLTGGATEERSYQELLDALYPMAAGVSVQVDEEVTVFSGVVHRDNLDAYTDLLLEMLGRSAYREEDLERIKSNAISAVDIGLRRSDDEELGKEVLLGEIFAGHPYEHLNRGTLQGIAAIGIDDVRQFVEERLFAVRPTIGLAGGFDAAFAGRLAERLCGPTSIAASGAEPRTGCFPRHHGTALLDGRPAHHAAAADTVPEPTPIPHNRMTIVEKQTLATGMHFGFPIEVTRHHPDWVALWLIRSWLGEHRSENSHLYQRLREVRGLNYGDYAYIEYFPNGGSLTQPPPNHPRSRPVFQVWLRPVPPENAPFALKAAWWELRQLLDEGLDAAEFEATRSFLSKFCALLQQSDDRRLGYALDQAWYGEGDWVDFVREGLARLTVDEVNRVLREHLRTDRLQFVVVTEDAEGFRDAILGEGPTPISYQTKPGPDVLAEDAVIEALRLDLRPEDVRIVPLETVFAK